MSVVRTQVGPIAALWGRPRTPHRAVSAAASLVLVAMGMLSLSPAASAGLYHPKPAACSFGADGTSGTTFPDFGHQVAFQRQSRRLYVAASGLPPGRLYGFAGSSACPAGEAGGYPPLAGFEPLLTPELAPEAAIAVDDSAAPSQGRIYLATGNAQKGLLCYQPGGEGCPGFPVAEPAGDYWAAVAVDPGGDVWAATRVSRTIYEFSPAGAELGHTDLSHSSALGGEAIRALAFDASGHLYVGSNNGAWRLTLPGFEAPLEIDGEGVEALAVDRATGDLYVAHSKRIARYDAAGEAVESFPASAPGGNFSGIAVDEASEAVYAVDRSGANKAFVFEAFTLPDLATAPLTNLGETSATLNGSVHPDGVALTGCRFEWVGEAAYLESGFEDLSSGGEAECEPAFGSIPTAGTTEVSAAISGLAPEGRYRFRLSAADANGENHSKPVAFALAKPGTETLASPIRTETTARLDSRIDPHGIATEYSFQYLSEAQFQADGESFGAGTQTTPSRSAGSGGLISLASEQVTELAPASTYRYRVVADNGAFGGAAYGEAFKLTTRSAAEESPSHAPYPGPPGSDRAWEQVNLPDTSGNPALGVQGIAADGDSAVYQVSGGTPVSEEGTLYDFLFARRPPDGSDGHPDEGWRTESLLPPRKDAVFSAWLPLGGAPDLSAVLGLNRNLEGSSGTGIWRLHPGASPEQLYQAPLGAYVAPYLFSEDGSRALLGMQGSRLDPDHASPEGVPQLYDVSSGTPRMASLLPGAGAGAAGPVCGVARAPNALSLSTERVYHDTYWVSANGRYAFFPSAGEGPSCGTPHLYMRDLVAEETLRIDGPPLSGPDCPGAMIRSTPGAVYLWTQSRLAAEDTAVGACQNPGESAAGGDVYRYQISSHEFACLTCVVPGGGPANVAVGGENEGGIRSIALAPEGPRLYFTTYSQLLPGAAEAGKPAIYRVNTDTGSLAYVAPLNTSERVGENPIGAFEGEGTAISPNGRYLEFRSAAAGLNQLSGSDNGGTPQFYLYDDGDPAADEGRSLSCASCPPDGSEPRGPVAKGIIFEAESAPNMTSIADDGDLAFATPTPLVAADQNTAAPGQDPETGEDVYEYRDGRALLVSDGQRSWPAEAGPEVATISPSGRDLFFTEAARLTPDATEAYARLYDARIGGGIDFPPAGLPPCDLNSGACEGPASSSPSLPGAGSAVFQGPGNPKAKEGCPKGKLRRKVRCVKRHAHRRGHRHHHHHRDKRHQRRAR